jgi:hypothetical protein
VISVSFISMPLDKSEDDVDQNESYYLAHHPNQVVQFARPSTDAFMKTLE